MTGTKGKVLTQRNTSSLFPESPCGDFPRIPISSGTSESRLNIKNQHRRRIRATNMSVDAMLMMSMRWQGVSNQFILSISLYTNCNLFMFISSSCGFSNTICPIFLVRFWSSSMFGFITAKTIQHPGYTPTQSLADNPHVHDVFLLSLSDKEDLWLMNLTLAWVRNFCSFPQKFSFRAAVYSFIAWDLVIEISNWVLRIFVACHSSYVDRSVRATLFVSAIWTFCWQFTAIGMKQLGKLSFHSDNIHK